MHNRSSATCQAGTNLTRPEPDMTVRVRPCAAADLEQVSVLFDQYRQFYRQPADPMLTREFITQRFEGGESFVLVAEAEGTGVIGFCQLYPSFCSVAAGPILMLYDLFVTPALRRHGAGRMLLQAAAEYARGTGAVRMDLATAKTNLAAQSLYESLGWARDDVFLHYSLTISR
jgi:ribosomal protein S18 acetylase RimI-like enzyme